MPPRVRGSSLLKGQQRVDLAMYVRAVPLLLKHPTIFVLPLLAAVVDLLVAQISPLFTNALGGLGNFIFQIVVQLVYGFCFGVAVIGASDVWRGRRAGFDDMWEEGRRKAGGILIATIGFYFLLFAAGYIASFFGSAILQIGLQLIVAYLLIYTIPAAAIGGMPGNLAISASYRTVRESLLASAILAIIFVLLWVELPNLLVERFAMSLGVIGYQLVLAAVKAIVLAYLAFPFAKQYDDVAFTRYW